MDNRKEFDTDAKYRVQLIKELIEIAKELKWSISIPESKEDEVSGIIMGTSEYISSVVRVLNRGNLKHE